MSSAPATKGRFGLGSVVLFLLMVLGVSLAVYRFARGLGSVTNLNQGYPWGFWIGADVLAGIALAAGGFVVAGLMHLFGGVKYEPLIRPTILTAFLGYIFFIIALLIDLGRPWMIWDMIFYHHHESPMFEVGWCVMCYTLVLFLEFLPVVFERFKMTGLHMLWKQLVPWVAIALMTLFAYMLTRSAGWAALICAVLLIIQLGILSGVIHRDPHMPTLLLMAGIIFSILHQSSLGTLFLMVPHKLSHIWFTPILPILFFVSAVMAGVGMVIVESTLSARFFKRKVEEHLLQDVGHVLCWAIIGCLSLRVVDLLLRGVGSELLVISPQSIAFWIEIVVGMLIPLSILLTPEFAASGRWLFLAGLMVVIGMVINRMNVAVIGISAKYGETYYPHWMEVAITAGIVSTAILAYLLICRHFPVLSKEGPEPAGA